MKQIRRYEFEGVILEIPLRYDSKAHMYIEEYPDFAAHPVYTPEGRPVLFSGEDACRHAEAVEGESCPDCGSCRFFRPAGNRTWLGVCGHPDRRRTGTEEAQDGARHAGSHGDDSAEECEEEFVT